MEDATKIIKVILPGICPHCGKEFLIASKMLTPVIDWVLKKEDINDAKEKVKAEVRKAPSDKFENEEERKQILNWLDNKETLFGPSEVDAVLRQVLKISEEKAEEKDTKKK